MQLVHVAPQRTGLCGRGSSTLTIEVLVVLKYGMLSFYQFLLTNVAEPVGAKVF